MELRNFEPEAYTLSLPTLKYLQKVESLSHHLEGK